MPQNPCRSPERRQEQPVTRRIDVLEESFGGTCEAFYTQLGDDPLARLHVIIKTTPGEIPDTPTDAVEARLITAMRGWEDNLHDALYSAHDEHQAAVLERRYAEIFPSGYRDRFSARAAVLDIERMENAVAGDGIELNLYRPPEATHGGLRFKIFNRGGPLALSDVLPVLALVGSPVC